MPIARVFVGSALTALTLGLASPAALEAQGRGNARGGGGGGGAPEAAVSVSAGVVLSVSDRAEIQAFYSARPPADVDALPPGIRRNLERGKPLPPGIAKKTAPPELAARIEVRPGFELVEVGLDVLLVEVATQIVHDVLVDVVR